MLDHILRCLPEEGCGLIGGKDNRACTVVPVTNAAHSPVRFSMEPLELLAALNQFEEQGLDVIAIFHSHPAGPVGPSATDVAEFNYPGAAVLIWSPVGKEWQIQGFDIDGGKITPLSLVWVSNETKSAPEG